MKAAVTPDPLESPVLPRPRRSVRPALAAAGLIAHLSCEFSDLPRRTQFLRARGTLALDIDRHWAGCMRRLDGPAADPLALAELWACLMEIAIAYKRDAESSPFDDWRIIAAGRAALFEGAARIIGDLIDPLPPPGIVAEAA